MAKNSATTKNATPAFVAGRRTRLFCLRAELESFSESILAKVGRTDETENVLDAMTALVAAIDGVKVANAA